MIESDVANADSRLAVRFYQKEMPNAFESAKEGRPIFYMADFIRIEVPGDRNSIIDTFVRDEHKHRFPIQWARYQNEKRDLGETDVQGTMLKDWPLLTSAQAAELKHFNFYTVEQIASASDSGLSNVGMVAGMSPHALREKAKAYLANAKDSAVVQAQADELRKRDQEIEALKSQMAELLAAKPKRGPKPAETTEG